MTEPETLELLFPARRGRELPLPPVLRKAYGPLRLPAHRGRPHVIANFASTIDGVVSLSPSGRSGGGEITEFDPHDRMAMGLLRAAADAIVVGAGTLRAVPRHRWTAERVYPKFAVPYRELRTRLHKPPAPLNVVVTARGDLDLSLPLFQSGEVPVLIVTTGRGGRRIRRASLPGSVGLVVAGDSKPLSSRSILEAIGRRCRCATVLVEGGPHLIGTFLSENHLDELFLTLVPQVAGRDHHRPRLSLVEGRAFAPEDPRWSTLVDVRTGGGLLLLRFSFAAGSRPDRFRT